MTKFFSIVGLSLVVLLAVTWLFFGWSVAWQIALCATTTTVFLAVAIYLDAKAGWHFTFVRQTDIKFVVKGGEVCKAILGLDKSESGAIKKNLESSDHSGGKIPCSDKDSSWLARTFGIHYVHWLYPQFRIHSFRILAEGLKDGSGGREVPKGNVLMREWFYHQDRTVDALRWKFPRPVLVEGVELQDGVTVDIIVTLICEVEDPYTPVFSYRGDFFPTLASLVKSATIDLVLGSEESNTYPKFIKMKKGADNPLSDALLAAVNGGNNETPDPKKGIWGLLGIKAVKAYIHDYSPSADQLKVEEAQRAESVAQMQAKAAIAEAEGKAKAMLIAAEARGQQLKIMVRGAIDGGVTPDRAAELVRTQIRMESVEHSKLTTFVEGGSDKTGIVVSPDSK